MTVISFASTQSGAGKTTSAIVLASVLARNYSVTVIDTHCGDELLFWAGNAKLERVKSIFCDDERRIHDEIDEARRSSDLVIIDLHRKMPRTDTFAMGESDLVIIPMGRSEADAMAAHETITRLTLEQRYMRRDIPVRLLNNRNTKAKTSYVEQLLDAWPQEEIGAFETKLLDSEAFVVMRECGCTHLDLEGLEIADLEKVIQNAELFAAEVPLVLNQIHFNHMKRDRSHVELRMAS